MCSRGVIGGRREFSVKFLVGKLKRVPKHPRRSDLDSNERVIRVQSFAGGSSRSDHHEF